MPEQESTTTTEEAATTATEAAQTDAGEQSETDGAEIDWKVKAREWEKRAKDNTTKLRATEAKLKAAEPDLAELNRLREASKTAEERAQEAAKAAEERAQAANLRVARAEVKAVLVAVGVDDPDGIADDLNLSKFLDSDGEVNGQAVAALKQKYAAFTAPRAPRPDPSQGSGANGRTPTGPAQEFAAILQQQIQPATR